MRGLGLNTCGAVNLKHGVRPKTQPIWPLVAVYLRHFSKGKSVGNF